MLAIKKQTPTYVTWYQSHEQAVLSNPGHSQLISFQMQSLSKSFSGIWTKLGY